MSKNIDVNEQLILNYLIADDCDSLKSEIEKGLDPNQQFFWIMSDDLPDILTNSPTLLSVAAFQRAVKCFNYLLEIGADINKLDEAETPICHFAVAGGSMEIIQKLDEKGVQFTSSLQIAAKYGRFEIFKWLLDNKGFDINERDQYNRTFLHIASEGGNCELVKFLIEKGLDINSIDGILFTFKLFIFNIWYLFTF